MTRDRTNHRSFASRRRRALSSAVAAVTLAGLVGSAVGFAQQNRPAANAPGEARTAAAQANGQPNIPHAGMLRFPDISQDSIVFSYANDLWIVPKEGGVARPLASPPGAETFPKTFASAVHRFWQHADQRAALAADLTLVPEAYREVLRFDMPTQYLMRRVKREVTLHGQRLQPGQKVAFLYPSANRDDREFPVPDRFDVRRRPPRILSFGHGIHACIGQHFARAEARLCIETLLRHAPEYEVRADRLRRLRTEFVQGWETMPVRWRS